MGGVPGADGPLSTPTRPSGPGGDGSGKGGGVGPLGPYRVLDLTTELGWLCGRLLADLGADVLKVEPPGGDPGRRRPPCLTGPAGPVSAAWLARNAGKRSLVLDLEGEAGRKALRRLLAGADFLIESYSPGHLDGLGLGWPALHEAYPRLVMTSITPYGQSGSQAGAPASDLEIMAAGGAMWLAGDPDRSPVRISLPQAAAWAGLHAAVGTLIAHHHRVASGTGQQVDCSAQAAVVHAISQAPMYWDMLRQNPSREGPFLRARNVNGAPIRQIWECADGYVTFGLYSGAAGRHSNRQLAAWMLERDMCPELIRTMDWDAFEVASAGVAEVEALQDAIAPFLRTVGRAEFFNEVLARRILGYPVATVEDIVGDEQLAARQVWQEVFEPSLDRALRRPTGFARMGRWTSRDRRPAPLAGEHHEELLWAELEPTETG